MVNTYKYKSVTWVDLHCPTRDEVRQVMEKYDLNPAAAEELIMPTPRPKVERYADSVALVLHFPAWKHSQRNVDDAIQEIDFVLGKDYIITSRYDGSDPLQKFAKMFEVNSVLDKNGLVGEHAGYLFYYMMREIYHSLIDELQSVRDMLEEIEKKIFTGEEREMVFEISKASRELLAFKHAMALHGEVLNSFASAAKQLFGPEYGHHLEAMTSEYSKVEKTIQSLYELLHELRETNNSLLETKQSQSIMTLTAITFIIAILGIPIALFEINFKYAPILGMPDDFWVFSGGLAALGIGFAAVLAHKKWL
ncbi:MAG: hypothetical protein KGI79_01190 [Patescibacteria group bacterium]|nr:hypothetical protein [Patescibacteria group bacterium]MDE2116472.1 hypothetical protein [Patescibacteria group bacterium]